MAHIPVLQKEVIDYLSPKANENFVDCTVGGGGHTAAILERSSPSGKVMGIEMDPELYQKLKSRMAEFPTQHQSGTRCWTSPAPKRSFWCGVSNSQFSNRLILVNDNFANLKEIIRKNNFGPVHGILFDIGLSSWHLEESGRGFSFLRDEPLIMRYDWDKTDIIQNSKFKIQNDPEQIASQLYGASNSKSKNYLTAEKIVNEYSRGEIERILKEYGEERFAKRIAQKIAEQRKIKSINSTFQLLKIIKTSVPSWYCRQKTHFATKTFQALRITVNSELENLKRALPAALEILEPNGRLVVISFHSLEDRIVKLFFREKKREGLVEVLTRKPVKPTSEEIKLNIRARSAKLRAAIKRNYAQ